MAYLEELLPEFRKGAKIRRSDWDDGAYLLFDTKEEIIIDQEGRVCEFIPSDIVSNAWELYDEPIDWDYIIKNKCSCWFWDGEENNFSIIGRLTDVYNESCCSFQKQNGSRWNHCKPVRRDEVTFYEDRKDEI